MNILCILEPQLINLRPGFGTEISPHRQGIHIRDQSVFFLEGIDRVHRISGIYSIDRSSIEFLGLEKSLEHLDLRILLSLTICSIEFEDVRLYRLLNCRNISLLNCRVFRFTVVVFCQLDDIRDATCCIEIDRKQAFLLHFRFHRFPCHLAEYSAIRGSRSYDPSLHLVSA